MRFVLLSISGLILVVTYASLSWADQLVLKNGDKITGEIKQIWDQEVTIEPEYDDDTTVTIRLALVDFIDSVRPFTLTYVNGDEVEVSLPGRGEDGQQSVNVAGQIKSMPLADIFELDEIDDYFDWESHIDINSAINRGNTRSTNVKLFADTMLKLGDHRHLASLTFDREEQNGETTKKQNLLNYNYNWLYANHWFVGFKGSLEQDPIRNLDHRYILGLTVGRDIWNTPRLFLNVQAGGGYLLEEDTFGSTNNSPVALWALKYRQDIFSKDFELYHDDSLTVYLEGRNNTVLKTVTGIRYDITDLLYLNASLGYDYESNPASDALNYDMAFLFGFGVEY